LAKAEWLEELLLRMAESRLYDIRRRDWQTHLVMAGRAMHRKYCEAAKRSTNIVVKPIRLAHIGLDRALGFGLKYPTFFKDTHLQTRKSNRSNRRSRCSGSPGIISAPSPPPGSSRRAGGLE
jgi:hypothetical protein